MPTSNVNLDITQYVRVNAGTDSLVLQAHRDAVRIAFSELKPNIDNKAFHILEGGNEPLVLPFTDTNVWALALTLTSSLSVTETVQLTPKDWHDQVSAGGIPGYASITVSGTNYDINGALEDLWPEGGLLSYLSAAETMSIVSTSASDNANLSVFISGVDDNCNVVTDFVVMNGTTPVISTTAFKRVNFMFITGTNSTNVGDITATATTAATVQCRMKAGFGITQHGFYTIPTGKNAIIHQVELNAAKLAGGQSPIIEFIVYARFSDLTPWIVILNRRLDTNTQSSIIIPFPTSAVLAECADIRLSATSTENNTICAVRLTGLLYDI